MFGEVYFNINQNKVYLTLKDLTLSKSNTISYSINQNQDYDRAEWHIEKTHLNGLADFQTLTFFNCSATISNVYSDFSDFNYVYSYNMVNSHNDLLTNLGDIYIGSYFSVEWMRAS